MSASVTGRAELMSGAVEVSAGDAVTLDALYAEHGRTVARWISVLLGPGAEVEDLTHDVFLVVCRRLREFRREAKATTWLYRITENVVRNERRRRRVRRWMTLGLGPEAMEAAGGDSPAGDLEARRRAALLYRALDRLKEDQRTVLVLFELEGASGAEIAERLGVSVSAVWVRLHRARKALLAALERIAPEGGR